MAREFQRGHKAKISDLTAGTDLYVGVQIAGPGLTFDISCFGLDADERLSDDRYFIFFNQPKSPEEAIQLLGAQSGDTESFRVTLDRHAAADPEALLHRDASTAQARCRRSAPVTCGSSRAARRSSGTRSTARSSPPSAP